jgi:methylated-DNA-[protein]-cysteine S-methyltransferase
MQALSYAFFETPVGVCAIIWESDKLAGVQLPESEQEKTRATVMLRFPSAVERVPHGPIARAIQGMQALLRGSATMLDDITLDMSQLSAFRRRVYEAARRIPPGSSLSYAELARRIEAPGAVRAVGQALGKNPFPIIVPCHRVVAAGGKLGGFSAAGGVRTKQRLLDLERGNRRSGS